MKGLKYISFGVATYLKRCFFLKMNSSIHVEDRSQELNQFSTHTESEISSKFVYLLLFFYFKKEIFKPAKYRNIVPVFENNMATELKMVSIRFNIVISLKNTDLRL